MATIFLLNTTATGTSFGVAQYGGTGPTTATGATGWTVGTAGPTVYSEMTFGSKPASSSFGSTAQPSTSPTTNDCFIVCDSSGNPKKFDGFFNNTGWTLAAAFIGSGTSVSGAGNLRVRVWRSTSTSGPWTEITTSTIALSTYTLSSSAGNTTGTWSAAVFGLTNEYLVFECAWEITTAAGHSNNAVAFRVDATNSIITTPAFAGIGAIADSITAPTDSVARVFVGARSIAESITNPSDSVARVAQFNRSITETITAPSDSVARSFVGSRSISESITAPSDAISRAFIGSRAISESIIAPSDLVSRLIALHKSIAESIATPSDTVSRLFVGSRNISESIIIPTDIVARSFIGARSIAESIVSPTDAISRMFVGFRIISEAVATPTDSVSEQVGGGGSFLRSISESITSPTDSLVRSFTGFRLISESISDPTDSVSRTLAAFRAIGEAIATPSDSVSGSKLFTESIFESISGPTDNVIRLFIGGRIIAEVIATPFDTVTNTEHHLPFQDGYLWGFNANVYPPTATSSNNELFDLDIVVYKLLGFYQGILNAHFRDRWITVTQSLGLLQASNNYLIDGYPIAQAIPYPVPATLKTTDYKFPLLSCYREDEKYLQQSTDWVNVESQYVVTVVFPPLTAPQYNRMYPFLSAFSKKILLSTFNQSDPLYNNNELVMKESNVSFIRPIGSKYGSLLGQSGNIYFPSIQIRLLASERNQFISSNYEAFGGFDVQDAVYDGYQPNNPISPFSDGYANPNIVITAVTPNTSSQAGNQIVFLTGSGFAPGNVYGVTLCGVPVKQFTYKTANQLLLISGASPAIVNGDVVVTDIDGHTYTLSAAFSYV